MPHALAAFISKRMDDRGLRQRDVVSQSGLSRALVSKYASDDRDKLTRLPDKATLEGFAKALGVSSGFLLGKAIEALDIGYTAGDFINSVGTASDQELLDEVRRRLTERGEEHAGSAPIAVTPEAVAISTIQLVESEGDETVEFEDPETGILFAFPEQRSLLDPTAGSGAFLLEAYRRALAGYLSDDQVAARTSSQPPELSAKEVGQD